MRIYTFRAYVNWKHIFIKLISLRSLCAAVVSNLYVVELKKDMKSYLTTFIISFGRVTASSESVHDNVWFLIDSMVFMYKIHTDFYNVGMKSDITMWSHNVDKPPPPRPNTFVETNVWKKTSHGYWETWTTHPPSGKMGTWQIAKDRMNVYPV